MNKYSKPRILLIAMVDHISGETAGESIEELYEAGALNVQIMNSITKKGRPGYLYVIDCDARSVDAVEESLVTKLGTTGWHRIQTEHCYTDVEYRKKKLEIVCGDRELEYEAACKYSPQVPDPYRIERESLNGLETMIFQKMGIHMSKQWLEKQMLAAFQNETTDRIDLKGE